MAAVLESINSVRSNIAATFARWTDPSAAVMDEALRNEALRAQVDAARRRLSEAQVTAAQDAVARTNQYVALRSGFLQTAEPALDALDMLDTAKIVYDQLEGSMSEWSQQIRMAGQQELQQYGYQSKMLKSLSLSYESLRHRLIEGQPYGKHLEAVSSELTDASANEVTCVVPLLRPTSESGVATRHQLEEAAKRLVASVDAVRLAESQHHAASSAALANKPPRDEPFEARAKRWFGTLRYENPVAAANEAREAVKTTLTTQADERAAADSVLAHIRRNELGDALGPLEKLRDSSSSLLIGAEATNAIHMVQGRLVADLALRYSDSMIAIRRFSFLESMITPDN
jgi:hypothetical protein